MSIINRHVVRIIQSRGYEYQNMDILTKKVGIPKIAKFNEQVKSATRFVKSKSNYENTLNSIRFYEAMNDTISCKSQIKEFNIILSVEKNRIRKISAFDIANLYIHMFEKHLNKN
mgnify:CR=1 FL=1